MPDDDQFIGMSRELPQAPSERAVSDAGIESDGSFTRWPWRAGSDGGIGSEGSFVRVTDPQEVQRHETMASIRDEARSRIDKILNDPVIMESMGDNVGNLRDSSELLQHPDHYEGSEELELNETNVRGMMRWALKTNHVKSNDREALFQKMEERGIANPEPIDAAKQARSELWQRINAWRDDRSRNTGRQ